MTNADQHTNGASGEYGYSRLTETELQHTVGCATCLSIVQHSQSTGWWRAVRMHTGISAPRAYPAISEDQTDQPQRSVCMGDKPRSPDDNGWWVLVGPRGPDKHPIWQLAWGVDEASMIARTAIKLHRMRPVFVYAPGPREYPHWRQV